VLRAFETRKGKPTGSYFLLPVFFFFFPLLFLLLLLLFLSLAFLFYSPSLALLSSLLAVSFAARGRTLAQTDGPNGPAKERERGREREREREREWIGATELSKSASIARNGRDDMSAGMTMNF